MKKIVPGYFLLIFSLFFYSATSAQPAGQWAWANGIAGGGTERNRSVATDNLGNVYICGSYNSGSLTIGSFVLSNAGQYDFYIAKYNSAGTALWAKKFGSNFEDYANAVVTDGLGNVYLAGGTNSASLTIGTTVVQTGMFLVKFNSNGDVTWVRKGTGPLNAAATVMAIDKDENLLVSGPYYMGQIQFDPGHIISTQGFDVYLVKYDSAGIVQWVNTSTATHIGSITTDRFGNVYMGVVSNEPTVGFGATIVQQVGLHHDIYLVKYSSDGVLLWATAAGSDHNDAVSGIGVDAAQNVYIGGSFDGDSIKFGNTWILNSGVFHTMYFAKYDFNGNAVWAKRGRGDAGVYNIHVDSSDNIYYAGSFGSNTLTVDAITFTNTSLGAGNDVFLLKSDADGNLKWGQSFIGDASEYNTAITSDANGDLYYMGDYMSSSITIGGFSINNSSSGFNGYVAKFHQFPDQFQLCPLNGNTVIGINVTATNFQWQEDAGSGFTNINDNAFYSGTHTDTLLLTNIPTSWYGRKYRCIFDGNNGLEYTIKFSATWVGNVNNAWENPLNWGCGGVPDEYTDVIVNTGFPQVNSNVRVRTLSISQNASLNVASSNNLTVVH